jgi:4'-phosphopantetheinyl transferase
LSAHHEAQSDTSHWEGGFGGLELWCIDLNAAASLLLEVEQQTPRLPQRDRNLAEKIADKRRANEWLAAHVALRILLERAIGAEWRGRLFVRGVGAKPHLAGAPVTFSLSHVPGWSLVGMSNVEPIGVDLERMRVVNIPGSRRILLERAAEVLGEDASLPERDDTRILKAWVRLEAFAKADGRGIGRLLTQLGIVGANSVQGESFSKRLDDVKQEAPPCAAYDLNIAEGLFAAAVMPAGAARPEIFRFPSSIKGIHELLD